MSDANTGAQRFSNAILDAVKAALAEPMDDRPNWIEMLGVLRLHSVLVERVAAEHHLGEEGDHAVD